MIEPPFEDLLWVIQRGLERGTHLLVAEELEYVHVLRGLSSEQGMLFSRLWLRRPGPYAVTALRKRLGDEIQPIIDALVSVGALHSDIGPGDCLPKMTVPQLRRLAAKHDLPSTGRKSELVSRLDGTVTALSEGWVRITNRRVLLWLAQWCFLRKHPPIRELVLERLGQRRWPKYDESVGNWGFVTRNQLEVWWDRFVQLEQEQVPLEELLDWRSRPLIEGRFSLLRTIDRHIWTHFEQMRSAQAFNGCIDVLSDMSGSYAQPQPHILNRHVRLLEQMGHISDAFELLERHFSSLPTAEQYAMMPLARRLGKRRNVGWRPLPVLKKAKIRTLRLTRAGRSERRPRYSVLGDVFWVEDAVRVLFENNGATLVRAEGGFLTSLYALCFSSLYFLPKGNMLPVRFLSGPLDVGRSAFYSRLTAEIEGVLKRILGGGGAELIDETWSQYEGVRLAGMHWSILSKSQWVTWAERVGPERMHALVSYIVRTGFRETAGFPDLVWVSGHINTMIECFPRRFRMQPQFLEVKSPNDKMSCRQHLWMDRLHRMGFVVEQLSIEDELP